MHVAPSVLELEIHSRFLARHSLPGFETPHHHWFGVVLILRPEAGQDLAKLEQRLDQVLNEIDRTDLNATLKAELGQALSPTVENIALWIWHRWVMLEKTAPIFVKVSNSDLEGITLGAATVGIQS
jgi:6-pyruvoyl-tetrahydropterin synthase